MADEIFTGYARGGPADGQGIVSKSSIHRVVEFYRFKWNSDPTISQEEINPPSQKIHTYQWQTGVWIYCGESLV